MTIEEILQKEEGKYYPLLKSTIEISPNYPLSKNEEDRLEDELEIIHKMKQSKVVWYCYKIVTEAKNKDEPYFIRGTMPDLYILYVLGLTKMNPMENGCCYQSAIGTKSEPKAGIYFDISFRWGFIEHIKDFANKIEPNSKVFHYSYHIEDNPIPYSPSSTIIFPDYVDVEDFCVVKDTKDDMKVVGMKNLYSFDIGVQFNLLSATMLSVIKKMQDLYGTPKFDDAFLDFKEVIWDEGFTNEYYRSIAQRINLLSFENALNLECFCHATHAKTDDVCSYIFPDRESVFYYFLVNIPMPENVAYKLSEDVRKGAFRRKYLDNDEIDALIPEPELSDLKNILYLFSRGHAAEYLYWRMLEAHYYKHHNNEYYIIKRAFEE